MIWMITSVLLEEMGLVDTERELEIAAEEVDCEMGSGGHGLIEEKN